MKVYYRDKSKVMRAIPGITYDNGNIFIEKSVYTITRKNIIHWVLQVIE